MGAAGAEHIRRAGHVRVDVALLAAPVAGLRRVVEHRVDALAGAQHVRGVGEVAEALFDAHRVELRGAAALRADDGVALGLQAAADRLAEETGAAGDEDLHALNGSRMPGRAVCRERVEAPWKHKETHRLGESWEFLELSAVACA